MRCVALLQDDRRKREEDAKLQMAIEASRQTAALEVSASSDAISISLSVSVELLCCMPYLMRMTIWLWLKLSYKPDCTGAFYLFVCLFNFFQDIEFFCTDVVIRN